jgi:hypothetical protein
MKKTVIILSALALIAGSYFGQTMLLSFQFDIKSTFKTSDERQFLSNKYTLTYVPNENNLSKNKFNIILENNNIGYIDFDGREYNGPGFSIWLYQTKNTPNIDIIIVEAQADNGTAWYYVTILKDNHIDRSFFIDEPRANSEKSSLSDFINIECIRNEFIFKFKKELIAGYSSVPNEMKQDEHNYIIISP